jgi:hypothetical protein
VSVDGWEDVTMGNKKPKAYTFTKNAGSQFNLLPDGSAHGLFLCTFQSWAFK